MISDEWSQTFVDANDILEYSAALDANNEDVEYISAINDWRPIYEQVPKSRQSVSRSSARKPAVGRKRKSGIDEKRRGARQKLRSRLRHAKTYEEWLSAANELDKYLDNVEWKRDPRFDYYDYRLIQNVTSKLKKLRARGDHMGLKSVLESCVKNNFGGIESPRLYSETYYGTKKLVDEYINQVEASIEVVRESNEISASAKSLLFKYLSKNYGRTALCLSGGASFAYYHFGVVRALLDQGLLPNVFSGTSGGGLIAALLCTRTNDELRELVKPELCQKLTACHEGTWAWMKRWWRTGARFDAVDWATRCIWFTRGSLTFKEAYERTGRVLNISVIPSDVHSPPKVINHLTAPDTVIWSALIASAAVPGILNSVPLMTRRPDGSLTPYNFGNKWKDGSLRTDIPLPDLNTFYNVTFSIVSQVNPHVQIFFYSPRGTVGRPVSHRQGRGWRGGFLGSALEQSMKHEMVKWLRVLRDLELLPRPLGQDWSRVFLQRFEGSITIWPKTVLSDFWYILTDPSRERLARMIAYGQHATFPKILMISHRLRIESAVERGRAMFRQKPTLVNTVARVNELGEVSGTAMSEEEAVMMRGARDEPPPPVSSALDQSTTDSELAVDYTTDDEDDHL